MERYYRRSPDVASRVVDGEAVLVKTPENVLFVLNRAGSRVWVGADGTRAGAELAGDGEAGAAEAFLDEMVERGLLERTPGPRESADPFPQDVVWGESELPDDPPGIVATEVIEVMAGPCTATDVCSTPISF